MKLKWLCADQERPAWRTDVSDAVYAAGYTSARRVFPILFVFFLSHFTPLAIGPAVAMIRCVFVFLSPTPRLTSE